MGNITAIGSDVSIDAVESIVDSGNTNIVLQKYDNEIKQLEQKSKLYFKKETIILQKMTLKSDSPLTYELKNESTIHIFNILNNTCYKVFFQKRFLHEVFDLEFFEKDLVLYIYDTTVVSIYKLTQKSNEQCDKYLAQLSAEIFPSENGSQTYSLFRFEKKLVISHLEGNLDFYDEKTGDLLKTNSNCIGNLTKTLNEDFIYSKGFCWYDMSYEEMNQNSKTIPGFHSISNDGNYILQVDYFKSLVKIYQTNSLRTELTSHSDNFMIQFSLINEITTIEFSYDSKYIIVICSMDKKNSNFFSIYELFIYSIEEKKFVLYIPDLDKNTFRSFENYLLMGTKYGSEQLKAYSLKLTLHIPNHKIKSTQLCFRDLQFKFK
eukprot:gene4589-7972_t